MGRVPRDDGVGERPAGDQAWRPRRHDRRAPISWSYQRPVPQVPSTLLYKGVLFMVNDSGILLVDRSGDRQRPETGTAEGRDRQVLRVAGRRRRQGLPRQPGRHALGRRRARPTGRSSRSTRSTTRCSRRRRSPTAASTSARRARCTASATRSRNPRTEHQRSEGGRGIARFADDLEATKITKNAEDRRGLQDPLRACIKTLPARCGAEAALSGFVVAPGVIRYRRPALEDIRAEVLSASRGCAARGRGGHGHGLTPDKSQMLPFTFCMGSTSLPLATPISALPISGSMRQSGELKCVT